jgi:hypothetical protein
MPLIALFCVFAQPPPRGFRHIIHGFPTGYAAASDWMGEGMISQDDCVYVSLPYFYFAGAVVVGKIRELHQPVQHASIHISFLGQYVFVD